MNPLRSLRTLNFLSVALALGLWLSCQFANGQVAPERFPRVDIALPPPLPVSDGPVEDAAAPEWSAWRKLYTSLDLSSQELVAPVETLRGLSPYEADAVLQAGYDYLRQLERIDNEARQEILTRFRPHNAPPLPSGVGPRDVIELPYGTTLKEILEPEGFIARLEERKQSLLDSHRQYLEQLIGPTKLKWLDNYVKTVVATSIKVVTKGWRLPGQELSERPHYDETP